VVNAAGHLLAFISHIKDNNFNGTAQQPKPATVTLLEGNVFNVPSAISF
jgi:hypothetical protein